MVIIPATLSLPKISKEWHAVPTIMKSTCHSGEPLTLSMGTMPKVWWRGKWGGGGASATSPPLFFYSVPLNLFEAHWNAAVRTGDSRRRNAWVLGSSNWQTLQEFDRSAVRSSNNKIVKWCQIIGSGGTKLAYPLLSGQSSTDTDSGFWKLSNLLACIIFLLFFYLLRTYFTLCRHLLGDFYDATNREEDWALMGRLQSALCRNFLPFLFFFSFVILYFEQSWSIHEVIHSQVCT